MKRLFVWVVAWLMLAGSAAVADDVRSDGDVEYFMDTADVHGEVVSPTGALVRGGIRYKQHSLIKVRRHFVVQMLESVEDI